MDRADASLVGATEMSLMEPGAPQRRDVVVTAGALLVLLIAASVGRSGTTWELPGLRAVLLAVLAWLPLLARTRWPVLVVAVSAALQVLAVSLATAGADGRNSAFQLALLCALFACGARTGPRPAWAACAASAIAVTTAMSVVNRASPLSVDALVTVDLIVAATALGVIGRARQVRLAAAVARADRAERVRAADVEREVLAERMRIARDLHDVLAHNVALINLQAGAARFVLHTDTEAAEQALDDIAAHARTTLAELGTTVGLLRSASPSPERDPSTGTSGIEAPTPGSGDLGALIAATERAGVAVDLTTTGVRRPLSPSADLALYRIAQEALTNAGKHAPGSTVGITVDWFDDTVRLRVETAAGTVVGAGPDPVVRRAGTGHGLIGMKERASSAGGVLRAGPRPGGGFAVEACLPVRAGADPGHDRGVRPSALMSGPERDR